MKKITLALIAISFIFQFHGYPADCDAQNGTVLIVKAKPVLNVRSGQGTDTKVLFTIPDGDMVYVEESSNKPIKLNNKSGCWMKVSWKGGSGWVFSAYLTEPEKVGYNTDLLWHLEEFNINSMKGLIILNGTDFNRNGVHAESTLSGDTVTVSFVAPVINYITFTFKGGDSQLIHQKNSSGQKVEIAFTMKKYKRTVESEEAIRYVIDFIVNSVK